MPGGGRHCTQCKSTVRPYVNPNKGVEFYFVPVFFSEPSWRLLANCYETKRKDSFRLSFLFGRLRRKAFSPADRGVAQRVGAG